MKKLLMILAIVAAAGLAAGCSNNDKEGVMTTRDFDLKDFTKIEVGGAFEVDITRADAFKVTVTADDFPHLRVEKQGDTLVIRRQGIEWFAPFHSRPKAEVALPVLTDLNISGASHCTLENFQSTDGMAVTLSGASQLEAVNISAGKIDLKATGASTLTGSIKASQDAKFDASGASKITLTGAGANITAKVSGASKVELSQFPAQNADVEISGASNAAININGRLDADVSGASKLLWSGSPIMGDIQTSGASSLKRQ